MKFAKIQISNIQKVFHTPSNPIFCSQFWTKIFVFFLALCFSPFDFFFLHFYCEERKKNCWTTNKRYSNHIYSFLLLLLCCLFNYEHFEGNIGNEREANQNHYFGFCCCILFGWEALMHGISLCLLLFWLFCSFVG